jgi:hypothetical protein
MYQLKVTVSEALVPPGADAVSVTAADALPGSDSVSVTAADALPDSDAADMLSSESVAAPVTVPAAEPSVPVCKAASVPKLRASLRVLPAQPVNMEAADIISIIFSVALLLLNMLFFLTFL